MKHRLRIIAAVATAGVGVALAPSFVGSAGALPPAPPPGVLLTPPAADPALENTDVACFNVFTHNPITTGTMPNQPLIGTIAFENRGRTFC